MEFSVKRTSNHSEQRLFREEVLSFASHIYMTLAILCRRRHKVAFIAELNLKFSSRFLRQRDACGMEISVKNQIDMPIFHTRDLCLRALDTNSRCAKSVRRNGD